MSLIGRRASLSVLAGGFLLSFASAIVIAMAWLQTDGVQSRAATTRGFNNLALSLERAVGHEVGDLDRALTAFIDARDAAGTAAASDPARAADKLSEAGLEAAGLSRELGPFEVIDASGIGEAIGPTGPGEAVAPTGPGESSPASGNTQSYAETAFFRALKARTSREFEVAYAPEFPPYISGGGMVVAKRLSNADGSFAGVVAGLIRRDRLIEMLSSYDLGSQGFAAILSADGKAIASFPEDQAAPVPDYRSAPAFQHLLRDGPGVFDAAALLTGSQRIYVTRKLPGLPIYILFSTPGIYAMPAGLRAATAFAMALLLAMLVLLGLRFRYELQRRHRSATEIVSAQTSARLSERKLQAYFDHFSQGLLGLRRDLQGEYVVERANVEAARLLTLPADVVGRRLEDVWDAKRWGEISPDLDRCLSVGGPLRKDLATSFDGAPHTIRLTMSAVHEEPETIGSLLLGSVEDFTSEEAEQAELRRHHLLEGVERLTSGIANEFNNVLQIITGHLELVRGDEADGHVRAAMDAATRGARLTSGLLSFSSKQVLRPESVSAGLLLSAVRESFEAAGFPETRLVTEVSPGTPPALADEGQLRLAMLNLCFNGHEAMLPDGGTLVLRAFAAEGASVAGNGGSSHYVVFAVTDAGHGMTSDIVEHAREPFFTTRGARLRLGMGLPMVDGFARQSGGELRLHSSDGNGTTAELWLPAAAIEPRRVRRRVGSEPKILLVEDTPDLLILFGDFLVEAGFDVTRAADPESALRSLRSPTLYDLLITDYAMQGMNGAQLIARACDLQPGLRSLIVTGDADEAYFAGERNAVSILRKPFRADQLLHHARELTA